jgi:hypothetical protein
VLDEPQVRVQIAKQQLSVSLGDEVLLAGALWGEVVPWCSTWYVDCSSGILHLALLKASRRGHYSPGQTNAETFWRALLANAPAQEVLQVGARAWIPQC